MPAWMTSLLRELVPVPKVEAESRTKTSLPLEASSLAIAIPTTPAPITTQSSFSVGTSSFLIWVLKFLIAWAFEIVAVLFKLWSVCFNRGSIFLSWPSSLKTKVLCSCDVPYVIGNFICSRLLFVSKMYKKYKNVFNYKK